METSPKRINVTLDAEHAVKLAQLAERTHLQEGTLARSLLSVAIDSADLEGAHVHMVLANIPGAMDRIARGRAQVEAGEIVPIDEI